MAKSEILRRVANKEMDIELALKILLLVSKDIENKEYEAWSYNEIKGYDQKVELPSYRVIKAGKILYSGVNGKKIVDKQPLPVSAVPFEIMTALNTNYVRNNIKDLIRFSNSTGNKIEKDLTMLTYEIFKNSGIRCEIIKMQFEPKDFLNILGNIRTRLLEALIKIDRDYGNLDKLYIDMIDKEKKLEEIQNEMLERV